MATCIFDGCDEEKRKRGFCSRHYSYARRHGIIPVPPCAVDGCGRPSHGSGLCSMHHHRKSRHGDHAVLKKAANGTASLVPCRECAAPSVAKGLCKFHFAYARRNGLVTKRPYRRSLLEVGLRQGAHGRAACASLKQKRTGASPHKTRWWNAGFHHFPRGRTADAASDTHGRRTDDSRR